MADAMCGPSNALQQFKQQTQVDRTLQQDRLTSRHQPAQGFRSHDPNATLLDPEFEAFQAGLDAPVLDHGVSFQMPGAFGGSSQAPSWASDFQRLQISSPQPIHQQQSFQPAPSASNWAQGFREHISQAAPRAQSSSPSPLAFQQRARGIGNFGYQPSFQQSFTPTYQSAKGKEPVMANQFDEAAFERAFDQASSDMMAGVEETVQEPQVEETISEQEQAARVEEIEAIAEAQATDMLREAGHDMDISEQEPEYQGVHSSDIEFQPEEMQIPREEENPMEQQRHDDDALALTAGELLEKVEHNQTDKFKNSNFLDLMRKLRDREVRVQGDKMVETTSNATDMAADGTLNAASSVDASQRLYYGKPQPVPLAATSVDTRSSEIPVQEQDHDQGRLDPNDGQEVVDLLNERGAITDDMEQQPPPLEPPSPQYYYRPWKPWPPAHRPAAGCFFKDDMEKEGLT